MSMTTYTVTYRRGGRENCTWHKTATTLTHAEAQETRATIQRMGYKAIVHKTDELNRIGMPEGWEA